MADPRVKRVTTPRMTAIAGPWMAGRLSLSGNHKKGMEPFRAGEDKQYLYGPRSPRSPQQKQQREGERKGHQGVDSCPKEVTGDHNPAYHCRSKSNSTAHGFCLHFSIPPTGLAFSAPGLTGIMPSG